MYELVGSDNVSRLLEDSGRKMFTDFNRTRPKTMLAIHACFFFFNGTAPTETYTLSLHDALPISAVAGFLDVVSNRAVDLPACHSLAHGGDRKSTRLNSSHVEIWYAVFCLKKEKTRLRNFIFWTNLLSILALSNGMKAE